MSRSKKPQLSPAQQKLAWKFQHTSPTMKSMGDAARNLDECFALMKGEMSDEEFREKTGHEPHQIRSAQKK